MKAVTLKPHEYADPKVAKKGNIKAFEVKYKRTDWARSPWIEITVVKSGRRVHFTGETDTDATIVSNANIALGIKTAARAFQDALDGKVVTLTNVRSFGQNSGTFALQRTGNRVEFVAPCGARGYITVTEAKKLIEVLRSL